MKDSDPQTTGTPQEPYPDQLVDVMAHNGQRLSPCARAKARAIVALGLAIWIAPDRQMRLCYDVWRGRTITRHILRRDGGRCVYCGAPATSADHLLAWSVGGLTMPANLVAACDACNNGRGTLALEQWLARHPAAIAHPIIEAFIADGGTTGHLARTEAIFTVGVPDPAYCTSARDVNRWLRLFRERNPLAWERMTQTGPDSRAIDAPSGR